jgi:uncharacterized protein YjbI with pentapeptide repeats
MTRKNTNKISSGRCWRKNHAALTIAVLIAAVFTVFTEAQAGRVVQGRHLQGRPMQGRSLQGRNLQGMNLQGMRTQGMALQGMHLQGLTLQGMNLQSPNLNGSKVNSDREDHANGHGRDTPSPDEPDENDVEKPGGVSTGRPGLEPESNPSAPANGYFKRKTIQGKATGEGSGTGRQVHVSSARAVRADFCESGVSWTREGGSVDIYDSYGLNTETDDPDEGYQMEAESSWHPESGDSEDEDTND